MRCKEIVTNTASEECSRWIGTQLGSCVISKSWPNVLHLCIVVSPTFLLLFLSDRLFPMWALQQLVLVFVLTILFACCFGNHLFWKSPVSALMRVYILTDLKHILAVETGSEIVQLRKCVYLFALLRLILSGDEQRLARLLISYTLYPYHSWLILKRKPSES